MKQLLRYFYRQAKKIIPPASAPIVLCYHAISKDKDDLVPFKTSLNNFREHLKVLIKYYNPISLIEFQEALSAGELPKKSVLVTFDDNYKSHLTVALPLLEEMRFPAVFFVGSDFIDYDREYFWDELAKLIFQSKSLPPAIILKHSGENAASQKQEETNSNIIEFRTNYRQKVYKNILNYLVGMDKAESENSMDSLRLQLGAPGKPRDSHKLLTQGELIQLGESKFAEIGSHTCNHLLLATKQSETQRLEILQDKINLEKILKRPVTCLAYPYGGPDDISDIAVESAEQAGFITAFTTDWQPIRNGYDMFRLPRLMIDNMTGDDLRSAIHFFK
jgi:peptidoglycan/xylan/chitin deacetylase (PgdA/CDA1 family)